MNGPIDSMMARGWCCRCPWLGRFYHRCSPYVDCRPGMVLAVCIGCILLLLILHIMLRVRDLHDYRAVIGHVESAVEYHSSRLMILILGLLGGLGEAPSCECHMSVSYHLPAGDPGAGHVIHNDLWCKCEHCVCIANRTMTMWMVCDSALEMAPFIVHISSE